MHHTFLKGLLAVAMGAGVSLTACVKPVQAKKPRHLVMSKIEVLPLRDKVTQRQYELYVKLPEGYQANTDKTYPVIYISDAMWSIELLSGTAENVIEDAILVGLSWQIGLNEDKPHTSRGRDYVPHILGKKRGEAGKYLRFVREQVFKFIESRFRASPDRRTYFGYSLGGMFGIYTLLTQPDSFDYYILGSPAFGSHPELLFGLPLAQRPDLAPHVFISYGDKEEMRGKQVEYFLHLLKGMSKKRFPIRLSIHKEVVENADHTTGFPKTALNSIYWLAEEMKKSDVAPEVVLTSDKSSYRVLQHSTPDLPEAFIDTSPSKRSDGLAVGTLAVSDKAKADVVQLAREIGNKQHGTYDSLLIAHNDALLFESYFLRGRVNLPHGQASATKSYIALAVGRAVQLGYLSMDDLNKPVLSFLKDVDKTNLTQGAERITLSHTMSMRSGIRIDEDVMRALRQRPELQQGQRLAQAYLEKSRPITEASQVFLYQGSDPYLTMQVLEAVVPGTAKDFVRTQLIEKLGIRHFDWLEDLDASMTSRDMVKWGTLVLHKGQWKGTQLVPKEFIEAATSPIAQPTDDEYSAYTYGYFFWLVPMKVHERTYLGKLAWGGGGQYIMTFDELDLVVVATARGVDDETIKLTTSRILPAFVKAQEGVASQ